ncbi:hypothetical protein V6N11_020775 [Hibiscus sabdariffa]|uniref:Uncharacterized protein n=1 Tax=Hibiscus sabdariffa TaxID=183260 RepID=A0ABR2Q9E4_9ROSI
MPIACTTWQKKQQGKQSRSTSDLISIALPIDGFALVKREISEAEEPKLSRSCIRPGNEKHGGENRGDEQCRRGDLLEIQTNRIVDDKQPFLVRWGELWKSNHLCFCIAYLAASSASLQIAQPSVATWWKATQKYYQLNKKPSSFALSLGSQILDENYSMEKSLTNQQIMELTSKGAQKNAINVVLTSTGVVVDGFCSSRCGMVLLREAQAMVTVSLLTFGWVTQRHGHIWVIDFPIV